MVDPAIVPCTSERVASRQLVSECLDEAVAALRKYAAWAGGFRETLAAAKRASTDLDPQLVWQDELVAFWQPFTAIQHDLFALDERLRRANASLADLIESYIDPPAKAQIEFATANSRFVERDRRGKEIAYVVTRLEMWHQNFGRWLREALREVESARREV